MNRRQTLALVAVLAAGAGLVTSTAGFSTLAADRGIQVAVADDAAAYLGVEQAPANTTNGTTDLDVMATNRFPAGTSLTVTVETGNGSATVDIASGERGTVSFASVACDGRLAINGTGPAVAVRLDRPVECA